MVVFKQKQLNNFLVGLILFLPPLVIFHSTDTFNFPKLFTSLILMGLLLIANGLYSLLNPKLRVNPRLLFILIFFWLIQLISTIFSVNKPTSILGRKTLLDGTLIFLTAWIGTIIVLNSWVPRISKKNTQTLGILLGIQIILLGIYEFLRLYQRWPLSPGFRIRSTIGEPNRLGIYLVSIFPLVFYLGLLIKGLKRIFLVFTSLIATVLIILTLSRGAWLIFISSFVVLVVVSGGKVFSRLKISPTKIKNVFLLCLTIFSLFLLLTSTGNKVLGRITTLKKDINNQSGSLFIRLDEWKRSLIVFQTRIPLRKIIGTGPNTAGYDLLKTQNPEKTKQLSPDEREWRPEKVRHQYLDLLLNSGLLGVGVFTIVIFYTLLTGFPRQNAPGYNWALYWSALTIAISGLIYYHYFLQITLLGIIVAFLCKPSSTIPLKLNRLWGLVLFLAGFLIVGITGVTGASDYLAAKSKYRLATKLIPWRAVYWRNWAIQFLNLAYRTEDPQNYQTARRLADHSTNLNSLDVFNLATAQTAYYLSGTKLDKHFHQQALVYANQRLSHDPAHASVYDSLGLIYLDLSRLDSAIEAFTQAININPDYRQAYLHLGESYKQQGNWSKALYYYQIAVTKFSNYGFAQKELEKAKREYNDIQFDSSN